MSEKKTLQELMSEKNLRLIDVELRSGVDISAISRIKNNKEAPNAVQRKKLAQAFGVGVTDINFPVCVFEEEWKDANGAQ